MPTLTAESAVSSRSAAELKRDAIVFGDINASTIAVTDGAIIQGYVNTTFLSKEDSRSVFPEAISVDKAAESKA